MEPQLSWAIGVVKVYCGQQPAATPGIGYVARGWEGRELGACFRRLNVLASPGKSWRLRFRV